MTRTDIRSDLIYDVGLHDGHDTAYYLSRGYRVVAIDANPQVIERAVVTFAKAIADQQLTLLNVGISATTGHADFWISQHEGLSSFSQEIASRDGLAHTAHRIQSVRFADLLADYGVPHYLKVDIEGHDHLCIEALSDSALPKYISVEAECSGDAGLSESQFLQTLELLREVGYSRFKLVKQYDLMPQRARISWFRRRLLPSLTRGRLKLPITSQLAWRFTDAGRFAAIGYPFQTGSCTGPWGEDIPGPWMNYAVAKRLYLESRKAFFSESWHPPAFTFWNDWHAKA